MYRVFRINVKTFRKLFLGTKLEKSSIKVGPKFVSRRYYSKKYFISRAFEAVFGLGGVGEGGLVHPITNLKG